jgi:hypothetical protein
VGLFDFLSKKPSSALQKHAARVADRRALAADRWESLQVLVKQDSEESTRALLARFTFHSDPSITDQEEKETAFKAIMARGEKAVPPIKEFIAKSESLSWPLKMLGNLVSPEDVLAILLEQLVKMDTEYERDPQRKLQILSELENRHGAGVVAAAIPFFSDVNETARFHAIGAAFAQDNAEDAKAALFQLLAREESVRVRMRALEGCSQRGWVIEPALAMRLPEGWYLEAGVPKRR